MTGLIICICVLAVCLVILMVVSVMYYLRIREQPYQRLFHYPTRTPLLNGKHTNYINFDNAASTLPFKSIQCQLENTLRYYSNIHRGTGYCSLYSTFVCERTREKVIEFLNGDRNVYKCIFTKNATESLNLLASIMAQRVQVLGTNSQRNVVLITEMDHHSNQLPWLKYFATKVDYIPIHNDPSDLVTYGSLNQESYTSLLQKYGNTLLAVSVTGASNVTGLKPPLAAMAKQAHDTGALFFVDAAQVMAHAPLDLQTIGADAVAFSAHKMFSPYGIGVLVATNSVLFAHLIGNQPPPLLTGGGVVELVTKDYGVIYKNTVDLYEAGTNNVTGTVALSVAINQLQELGMKNIEAYEQSLYRYAYNALTTQFTHDQIVVVSPDPTKQDCVGILTFYSPKLHYNYIAARAAGEYNIGLRAGCFCAHVNVVRLLQVSDEHVQKMYDLVMKGDRSQLSGLVRCSFAIYNTTNEIDIFIEMLHRIISEPISLDYKQDPKSGDFIPINYDVTKYHAYINVLDHQQQAS